MLFGVDFFAPLEQLCVHVRNEVARKWQLKIFGSVNPLVPLLPSGPDGAMKGQGHIIRDDLTGLADCKDDFAVFRKPFERYIKTFALNEDIYVWGIEFFRLSALPGENGHGCHFARCKCPDNFVPVIVVALPSTFKLEPQVNYGRVKPMRLNHSFSSEFRIGERDLNFKWLVFVNVAPLNFFFPLPNFGFVVLDYE